MFQLSFAVRTSWTTSLVLKIYFRYKWELALPWSVAGFWSWSTQRTQQKHCLVFLWNRGTYCSAGWGADLRHDNKGQAAQLASQKDTSSLAKTTKRDFCLNCFFQGLSCCPAPDLAIDLKRKKDWPIINFSTLGTIMWIATTKLVLKRCRRNIFKI